MRDVGAQPVALLQRTLQHGDGARDVADLVDALDAGHVGFPVAARDRAHRFGDLHQRTADALRDQQHDAGEQQDRRNGRGDQPDRERTAFRLADAYEFVAQRMKLTDRGERAGAPFAEQRLAARPVAAVLGLQQG